MKLVSTIFITLILCAAFLFAEGEPRVVQSKDFALMVSAECNATPTPNIVLTWSKNELAIQYFIFRKTIIDQNYPNQPIATLDSLTFSYTDNNVEPGVLYDYEIRAYSLGSLISEGQNVPFNFIAFGYAAAGIEIPAPDNYGWALVLVDETMMSPAALQTEIERLREDLRAEGWGVIIRTAPRGESFDGAKVKEIKKSLIEEYKKTGRNIQSCFIIGRVPVPYSGNLNPDAHPDHLGAWPADIYYGYMDNESEWTDVTVNSVVSGQREENKNVPGDGKFDLTKSSFQNANFGIGRVDFYNMEVFFDKEQEKPEVELLRMYLNKNHNYRTGQLSLKYQGLIDDNFGPSSSPELAFASSGWRNLGSLLGGSNIKKVDFLESLQNDSYLWAYGCGGGTYESAGGIGNSTQMAPLKLNGVYTMLFGSYFGDWDHKNSFLRAPLATSPSILTCAWAGRPHWFFHHMAANLPIGYSALSSHNNLATYKPNVVFTSQYPNGVIFAVGMRQIHTALMGDPTLRMYAFDIKAPTDLTVSTTTNQEGKTVLNWNHVMGTLPVKYNVYRSTEKYGLYTKINSEPIESTGTTFTDDFKYEGEVFYSVRATALQKTNTATFYNSSKAIFASVILTDVNEDVIPDYSMAIYPNPVNEAINLQLNISESGVYSIEIIDLNGIKICSLFDNYLNAGTYNYSFNLIERNLNMANGIYLVKLSNGKNNKVEKISIIR